MVLGNIESIYSGEQPKSFKPKASLVDYILALWFIQMLAVRLVM